MKDIKINSYLTYAEIQSICDTVCGFDNWAEREQNIDILALFFATNLSKEDIDEKTHDEWLKSGVIDRVKKEVINFNRIYEAIEYTESTRRALAQILKEMPKILEPLKEVMAKYESIK